jgi:hypothetical protein
VIYGDKSDFERDNFNNQYNFKGFSRDLWDLWVIEKLKQILPIY